MNWFGKSWGSPVCDPEFHVPVPIGESCVHCEEVFVDGDSGLTTTFEREHFHAECFIRVMAGSVGHIRKKCSCFGGIEEDPPGLTRRQAAMAAWKLIQPN